MTLARRSLTDAGPGALLAIALVCALACVGPGAAAPRSGPDLTVHRSFPRFPPNPIPPSNAELAGMLVSGLPAQDRAAATRLLLDDILPWDLRDLPSDPAATPSPRAIAHAAYNTLARQLDELAPDRRLPRLATMACARRGGRIIGRATELAVARYVADHGRPRSSMVAGYLHEARAYLAMTADELRGEADRIDHDLAAFERDAQADVACIARQRAALAHARQALGAARSGQFDAATDTLRTFLRYAGPTP